MYPKFDGNPNSFFKTIGGYVVDDVLVVGKVGFDGTAVDGTTVLDVRTGDYVIAEVSVQHDTTEAAPVVITAVVVDTTSGESVSTDVSGSVSFTNLVTGEVVIPGKLFKTTFNVAVAGLENGDFVSIVLKYNFT